MKKLFYFLLVICFCDEALSFMYSTRRITERSLYEKSSSDPKAGMNTYAQTFEEEGRIKVSVRGCGSRVVIANSKGEAPPVGQIIQMNMSRCKIIDWVK